MLPKWFTWIDQVLLGSALTLFLANRHVYRKIQECEVEQFSTDRRLVVSKPDIEVMLTLSIQRLERIENKAMGTLLGIAVAVAVFGATSKLFGAGGGLVGGGAVVQIVGVGLVVVSMLYLVASGLLALGAYRVGEVFRPTLADSAPVAGSRREKMVILYAVEQNQRAATLRSNRLSASFTCLRNGLVLVLALGILIVGAGHSARAQSKRYIQQAPLYDPDVPVIRAGDVLIGKMQIRHRLAALMSVSIPNQNLAVAGRGNEDYKIS